MSSNILLRSAARGLRNDRLVLAVPFARCYTKQVIKEGDTVLLSRRRDDGNKEHLTSSLRADDRITLGEYDWVHGHQLIGKSLQDFVISDARKKSKMLKYRIHQPTLGDYVRLSPRIVTPIYPQDANTIVSLLDLNPTPSGAVDETVDRMEKLEIFEAGTGHGSLTLHLARAIHAANTAAPEMPQDVPASFPSSRSIKLSSRPDAGLNDDAKPFECLDLFEAGGDEPGELVSADMLANQVRESNASDQTVVDDVQTATLSDESIGVDAIQDKDADKKVAYDMWRANRRAVIQTLDSSAKHSAQAQKTVRNFRHGMYFHNVDFHVGSIEEYLSSRMATEQDLFLDHAILDLPQTHAYVGVLAKCLKHDGKLVTFSPNITQIQDVIREINTKGLPFQLERILELAGGEKQWDIRMVRPRAIVKAELEEKKRDEGTRAGELEKVVQDESRQYVSEYANPDAGYQWICRPKVGERIVGGGFVGVWRRVGAAYFDAGGR